MQNLIVVCADIGSVTAERFGWWSSIRQKGTTPSSLAAFVAGALDAGFPVALGFECPLFVPLAYNERQLTSARPGEGSRPWSAGAGCGALTTGLVQVAWVLQEVRKLLTEWKKSARAYLRWEEFEDNAQAEVDLAPGRLFVWEAFISGAGKALSYRDATLIDAQWAHVRDACIAVEAFEQARLDPPLPKHGVEMQGEQPVYSLIGAALLRTGWSDDLGLLSQPCVVIMPALAAVALK